MTNGVDFLNDLEFTCEGIPGSGQSRGRGVIMKGVSQASKMPPCGPATENLDFML